MPQYLAKTQRSRQKVCSIKLTCPPTSRVCISGGISCAPSYCVTTVVKEFYGPKHRWYKCRDFRRTIYGGTAFLFYYAKANELFILQLFLVLSLTGHRNIRLPVAKRHTCVNTCGTLAYVPPDIHGSKCIDAIRNSAQVQLI